jgi:hypothetical protein
MEMKADIAGKPKDTMFHKIYIQRHENVRYKTDLLKRKKLFKWKLFVNDLFFLFIICQLESVFCSPISVDSQVFLTNARLKSSSAYSMNFLPGTDTGLSGFTKSRKKNGILS